MQTINQGALNMAANGDTQLRRKPGWLAWAVSIVEAILLLGFAFALSRYWLMLPVWMRRTAGTGLALAFLVIVYRLLRFNRNGAATKTLEKSAVEK
jgi:hypothetical protein